MRGNSTNWLSSRSSGVASMTRIFSPLIMSVNSSFSPAMHEGERFVTFIESAKTTGEQHNGIRVPDERQLASKKVFEGDKLLIVLDDRVGRLFPRQPNIGPKTLLDSRTLMARLHDAGTGAG